MKAFNFVALNSSGKKELGTVKAWTLLEAKRKVQQKGFYLVSIDIEDDSIPYTEHSFSFFKELKEIFFSKKKVNSRKSPTPPGK